MLHYTTLGCCMMLYYAYIRVGHDLFSSLTRCYKMPLYVEVDCDIWRCFTTYRDIIHYVK